MSDAGEWAQMINDLRDEITTSMNSAISTAVAEAMTDVIESIPSNDLPSGFGPLPWSRPLPPSGWVFADGSVLLAATPYANLRAAYIADGFPYGQDGSGNPKIPDMRGVVPAGRDNMGGIAAGRLSGATTVGTILGAETHTLTAAQMPSHNHTASTSVAGGHAHTGTTDTEAAHTHTASTATGGSHSHTVTSLVNGGGVLALTGGGSQEQTSATTSTHAGHTHSVTVNSGGSHAHALTINAVADHSHTVTVNANGSGAAHNNVQPTVVTNWIVKT